MRIEKENRKVWKGSGRSGNRSVAKWISVSLIFFLISGLATSVFAYDTCGEVEDILLDKNGRTITYYDIYGGKTEGRPDTSDQTQFYTDVVMQQDNFLKWANLAYDIFSSEEKSYWDHAGNGWDRDFGDGHYIHFIDDMMRQRSNDGDNKMKSTGISIANSLSEVQNRAANDIAGLIHRKVKGSDFLSHHKIDKLDGKAQTVIYSTVSHMDHYGKSPQFGYNSFTIAFYDFQLHVLDDGKELNTVTGDDTLEEASGKITPGFSYSNGTVDDGLISLSQNDSTEDATATLSLDESVSSSVSSSISHSENYSFGQSVGLSTKFNVKVPLVAQAEMTVSGGLEFGQAIGTAYSDSKDITTSQSKSSSVTMTVPAHTVVGANQTKGTSEMTTTYDCPIGVSYKVAIFSMCGTVYDDNMLVQSFSTSGYDQRSFITIFGNDGDCSDAVENLYQRASKNRNNSSYDETYGYTKGTRRGGDVWCTRLNWNSILGKGIPKYESSSYNGKLKQSDDMINGMINRYPMSISGASSNLVETGINSQLATPIPLYPIQYIRISYQLTRDFELQVGDTLPIYSYRVKAYDQDMVPYYGFSSVWGEWKIVDANGNPVSSDVAEMTKDPVTQQQSVLAKKEGTAYVKYFIDEGTYVDYTGRVSTNDSISSPAYKVVVTAEEKPAFEGRIDLTGEVTAEAGGEPVNLNEVETLNVMAYDKTDKQVDLTVKWEAQELEKSGIKVTEDGVLTVSKPGTFHVRAFYQDVYSDWAVVNGIEALGEESLIITSESAITTDSSSQELDQKQEFNRDTMMSRGEFIQLLYSLCGSSESASTFVFHDVDFSSVYREALSWAQENGLIRGGADGAFEPESGLTKQQMAVILFQMAKAAGLQTELSPQQVKEILQKYADGDQIEAWAQTAMAYAVEKGYIKPDENNQLNGRDYVERPHGAEAMTDAARDAEMLPDEVETPEDEGTISDEKAAETQESGEITPNETETQDEEETTPEAIKTSEDEQTQENAKTLTSDSENQEPEK